MDKEMEISFRNLSRNPVLEDLLRQKAEKFSRIMRHVTGCRLTLEKSQKKMLTSGLYKMRIDIALPRRQEIIVKKEAKIDGSFPKINILINDAFKAAKRKLEEIKRKEFLPLNSINRKKQDFMLGR